MPRRQGSLPRSAWLFAAAGIPAALIILSALLNLLSPGEENTQRRFIYALESPDKWEIREGDLAVREGRIEEEGAGWKPLSEYAGVPVGDYWLRRTLPLVVDGRGAAALHFRFSGGYEVYVNDELGLSERMTDERKLMPASFSWNRLSLPYPAAGSMLQLRLHAEPSVPVIPGQIIVGAREELLFYLFKLDLTRLTLAVCYFFLAMVGLCVWVFLERSRAYLYFACLTFAAGYSSVSGTGLVQVYLDAAPYARGLLIANPAAAWAIAGILERLSDEKEGSARMFGRLRRIFLVLIGYMVVVCLASPKLYEASSAYILAFILLTTPFVLTAVYRTFRDRRGEAAWLAFGLMVVLVGIGADRLYFTFSPLTGWVSGGLALLPDILLNHMVLLSLFCLIFSLGMVLVIRERERKRTYAARLETMVGERTAELERTTVQLRESVRERAETLAENTVMKERNRISEDIHDHVGHTLTATIVQLEAAVLLMERGDSRGVEKARQSQELVRRGLNEIRESVHRMKSGSDVGFSLEPALTELLDSTAETAGVEIEYRIGSLPILDAARQRTILQALKEGLTNGIRHGRSRRFGFRLEVSGEVLEFRLWNDGLRYDGAAGFGFGLLAMQERVAQLEGTMSLAPGEINGCELSIDLPLRSL